MVLRGREPYPVSDRQDVLTRREVAQLLRISVRTVDRLRLPSMLVGRLRRFLRQDVDAFLEERRAA